MAAPIHKVLLIAPDTEMPLGSAQIQDIIRSGLDVTPMLGQVTMPEVQRTIADGRWDCLWVAAHGNPDGFLLADGLVRSAELVQLVGKRFRLVVLNSCESLLVGSMLQSATPAAVVVTQATLPDRTAYLTGANFARELARHGDPERAYRVAHPGGANIYLYLAGMSGDFLAEA